MTQLCEMDEHEWVPAGDGEGMVCQACGVRDEDLCEAHSLADMDLLEEDLEHGPELRGWE